MLYNNNVPAKVKMRQRFLKHDKIIMIAGILLLSIIKLVIHLIGNRNYGFHRDELLHLSASEHLDWGYMEFPPFIALIGKIQYILFDYSLLGTRIFPMLCGVGIVILSCFIAKELGGKSPAILLTGICVLSFMPFYRNHLLFQPVAFDQFFWTLGFFLILKYINTQKRWYLLGFGITAGLGLMNKYTMIIFLIGILLGVMIFERKKFLNNKYSYFALLIALAIILPNIIWQIRHDFPAIDHITKLKETQLNGINRLEFFTEQFHYNPFVLAVSFLGLIGLIFLQPLKKYKMFGIAVLSIILLFFIQKAKAYYLCAAYSILFASGAVMFDHILKKRKVIVLLLLIPMISYTVMALPHLIPIMPVESYIKYASLEKDENNRVNGLTGDYADMFGWEEQAILVDSVYNSLSESEKEKCILWAENYGEAGAINILGKKYGLPAPVCKHGSFWLWGPGNNEGYSAISLGNQKHSVEMFYEEFTLIKTITHPYAIDEENNIPLYLCKKPKISMQEIWPEFREHVFD